MRNPLTLEIAMRVLPLLIVVLSPALFGECIAPAQAASKIGASTCIRGDVIKVVQTESGTHFLNFCSEYRECPFTVVVFPRDLRHVGDIRQLQGRTVEVYGKVQLYAGRAEIILREAGQLHGESAKLPPLPKTFDVERRGKNSPGSFGYPYTKHGRGRRGTTGLQPLSKSGTESPQSTPDASDDLVENR